MWCCYVRKGRAYENAERVMARLFGCGRRSLCGVNVFVNVNVQETVSHGVAAYFHVLLAVQVDDAAFVAAQLYAASVAVLSGTRQALPTQRTVAVALSTRSAWSIRRRTHPSACLQRATPTD